MAITRENIFELLGRNSKRYHSCVATTFTFDFSFFEHRAVPALKAAGIRNILVLLDDGMLAQAMEDSMGLEFTRNANYSFFPMASTGVFHPKMIFCTGKKECFLAVGSGNLTSAGHGGNDELWSVFHYEKSSEKSTSYIIKQAWDYVQSLSNRTRERATEKIAWISQYSPWLNDLPESDYSLIPIGKEEISLKPVQKGISLLKQIIKEVPSVYSGNSLPANPEKSLPVIFKKSRYLLWTLMTQI